MLGFLDWGTHCVYFVPIGSVNTDTFDVLLGGGGGAQVQQ